MRNFVYSIYENKVVCVTKYAGKAIRGIAKCDERFDEFKSEVGRDLSKARCNVKLRKKMVERSQMKVKNIEKELANLQRVYNNMKQRYNEDLDEYVAAKSFLKDLENSLN